MALDKENDAYITVADANGNFVKYDTTPPSNANISDGAKPTVYLIHKDMATTNNIGINYGSLVDFTVSSGHLQFRTDTPANEIYARSYWWTSNPSGFTYPSFVKLWHSGNFSPSSYLTTANAASTYLTGTSNKNITVRASDSSNTWSALGFAEGDNTKYNFYSIRFGATPHATFGGTPLAYGSGIMFGGSDTRAFMAVAYSTGHVEFGGGNASAPAAAIGWHFGINGTNGVTYDLPTIASNASSGATAYSSLGSYLPKSGGTISNTSVYSLYLNNTTENAVASGIRFQLNGATVGSIYCTSGGEIWNADNKMFYHTGNSNLSTVDWTTKALNVNGRLYMKGGNLIEFDNASGATRGLLNSNDSGSLLWYDTAWRTVYHSGNFTPGNYVAKSGDTMTGGLEIDNDSVQLVLKRTSSNNSAWLRFSNSGGILGNLGFHVDGSLVVRDTGWTTNYTVWHSGNSNLSTVNWACKKLSVGLNDSGWSNSISSTNSLVYLGHASGYAIYAGTKSSGSSVYLMDLRYGQTSLGTGGSSALYVRADGNVGIGTTAPEYKLHVNGNSHITGWIRFANGQGLHSLDTSGYGAQLVSLDTNNVVHFGYGGTGGVYQTRIYGNPLYFLNNNRQIMASVSNTGKFVLGANIKSGVSDSGDHAALLETWVNSTDVKYIASLCNARNNATVGYGVGIKFKFSSGDDGLNKYLGLAAVASSAYGNGRDFVFYNYTTELARITGTGNFNITGTSGWTGSFASSNNIVYMSHANANSGGMYIGTKANTSSGYALRVFCNQTTLASGGSCALAVRADGNVGIGVESPARKLAVDGTIGAIGEVEVREDTQDRFYTKHLPYGLGVFNNSSKYTGGWNAQIAVGKDGTNSGVMAGTYMNNGTVQYYWYGGTSNSNALMAILPGGNVGIGTTSPSQKLHVVGQILSTGDQVISSDETLKENITPLSYTVNDIANARAVSFDWKDGRGHSAGSIAQDWEKFAPEFVRGEEGNKSLAYAQLGTANSVILAKKVVEMDAEIELLKKENAELKTLINEVLAKLK